MNTLQAATLALVKASNGNPVLTTATVMLFWIMFNIFEAELEKLIFGERFAHWADPFFTLAFIAYAAYAVYCCAIVNTKG